MTIIVKSRTNILIMFTTNIWRIISKKISISLRLQKILQIFCHAIQQNINRKTIHFLHANLEKNVYKMVTWVIYYKDYS